MYHRPQLISITTRCRRYLTTLVSVLSLLLVFGTVRLVHAGTFVFANETTLDTITHPTGYTGTGGELTVGVCLDATSVNAAQMEIPLQNAIRTWNQLTPTSPNLFSGDQNDIPMADQVDWESVAVHEIGHCIGLGHPNIAGDGPEQNYTSSTKGADGVYNVAPGTDMIIGSSDDVRGDDVNLHWFYKNINDPFFVGTFVDKDVYSRDKADLPAGHLYIANGDRAVGNDLGFPDSEAVMQQGQFPDEAQRTLSHDDVATLRLGMSGLDELQPLTPSPTDDDYTVTLVYRGQVMNPDSDATCNLVTRFSTDTGFAVCEISGLPIQDANGQPTDHVQITKATLLFNPNFNWYFNSIANDQPLISMPLPSSTLTGSSVTFHWASHELSVDQWDLWVGTNPGGSDLFNLGKVSGEILSANVTGLPTTGATVYVRLFYREMNGTEQSRDFQYISHTSAP